MNEHDEQGQRVARLLDESAEHLTARQAAGLARARQMALARYQPQRAAQMTPALAGAAGAGWTERSVLGVRYFLPVATLLVGLVGITYMHSAGVPNDISDIDAGLLTDELPINAYLDQDFESWLKRSSH